MSILAINVAPDLTRELNSSSIRHRIARNVQQALSYLEKEDFQLIIDDIRQLPDATDDLGQLLAATPPGTIICALASNLWLPESEYWRSQGIKLVFGDAIDMLPKLLGSEVAM
jgi:hypothetical protein